MSFDSRKILDSITEHLNEVLRVSERPPVESVAPEMRLREDLGLDSLELAELTVRLEAEFGVDIFRDGLVASVGQIMDKLAPKG